MQNSNLPKWPPMRGYRDIDLGLGRVEELLYKLGNPHLNLPPIIHVAGTNGKGSSIAFLQSILKESGYKTHIYTSPHLVRFNERIVLAGEQISDKFLDEICEECRIAAGAMDITFFEGVTVAALLAFSKVDADIILLETGLGGRLDATNIIKSPLISLITSISLEHQDYLGQELHQIAYEKSCIIKENSICVAAYANSKVSSIYNVLQNKCDEMQAQLLIADEYSADTYQLGLCGEHQKQNAANALSCVDVLRSNGFVIDELSISAGLKSAYWPARMQNITSGKLVEMLTSESQLWLDGGHNQAASLMINEFFSSRSCDLYVIFAMLPDKDIDSFLAGFKDTVNKLYILNQNSYGGVAMAAADIISTKAVFAGIDIQLASDVVEAMQLIKAENFQGDILICGSLYLAGDMLAFNNGVSYG